MGDSTFIKKIKLTNFLSFGPKGMELELKPLNVLIGANATGKSNMIEAFSLLKAESLKNLHDVFNKGGGVQWLWKGKGNSPYATIETCVSYPHALVPQKFDGQELVHSISFTVDYMGRFLLKNEKISKNNEDSLYNQPQSIYDYNNGTPIYNGQLLNLQQPNIETMTPVEQEFSGGLLLSQTINATNQHEAFYLYLHYQMIRIYRIWYMNKEAPPRTACESQAPSWFLYDNAYNLALVLNNLETHYASIYEIIINKLKYIYPDVNKLTVGISQGNATIYLHENSLAQPVPALRFSDGLLRYLCLLTILCHPSPPRLICIEEPEIGLHPDAIVELAKLLKEASQRTQLIITTHSDILVSHMTDTAESVVVCERDEDGTHMERLEPDKLKSWLKDEYLGDLWLSGGIGGTL
ncbi:MAG: AAA family ATPase [bacterium]|nr:AAA family ATPase [bacterium]